MEIRDIYEFENPERQEELTKIYGSSARTWDDVETWDDCIIKEQKAIISDLESEFTGERCPFIEKLDNYFYYCRKRADYFNKMGLDFTEKPEMGSAQYCSNMDHFSLQLWCMKGEERYSNCINYRNL